MLHVIVVHANGRFCNWTLFSKEPFHGISLSRFRFVPVCVVCAVRSIGIHIYARTHAGAYSREVLVLSRLRKMGCICVRTDSIIT